MKLVLLSVLLPAVLAGCFHSEQRPDRSSENGTAHTSPSTSSRGKRSALYGYGFDYLAQLDPLTLRIKRKLPGFAPATGGIGLSPDGARLLQGAGFMGEGDYAIADARRMRWLDRSVSVAKGPGGYGYLEGFAWLRPRRVFALDEGTGPVAVGAVPWTLYVILDPSSRRVLVRRRLPGFVLAHEQFGDRELLLLAPFDPRQPHRVALVDADGKLGLLPVRLPRTRLSDDGFTAVGFALDKAQQRLFLLPGGAPIAVVDLRRFSVRYRAWPRLPFRPVALAYERPPENNYGGALGPQRWACWLGQGVFAVTGEDDRLSGSGSAGGTVSRPYGLELIDTRRWRAKLVTPRANRLTSVGSVLLASVSDAFTEQSPRPPGLGLTAYSRAGRLLFHRYGRAGVSPFAFGKLLYVRRGRQVDLLALPSGRLVRRIRFADERQGQLFPALGWQSGEDQPRN